MSGSKAGPEDIESPYHPLPFEARLHAEVSFIYRHFSAVIQALGATRHPSTEIWRVACDVVYLVYKFLSIAMTVLGFSRPSPIATKNYVLKSDGPAQASHPTEEWFLLPGFGVSDVELKNTLNILATAFDRPITAIRSRPYSILFGLPRMMLQRVLDLRTAEVHVTFKLLTDHLVNYQIDKVVVIAHCEGALIASLTVDRLIAEAPYEFVEKLEVYTFGSAAQHFNEVPPSGYDYTRDSFVSNRYMVPRIEHFLNNRDPIVRWVKEVTGGPLADVYAGQVFERRGAQHSGHHSLIMDYMKDELEIDPNHRNSWLDIVVANARVEEHLQESGPQWTKVQKKKVKRMKKKLKGKEGSSTPDSEVQEPPPQQPKKLVTVRFLSRLWQYLGGGEPECPA